MHHGKDIVRPCGLPSRALIAVGHKVQRTHHLSNALNVLINDIPDGHAVGTHAKGAMIWHSRNTTNCTVFFHGSNALQHQFFTHAKLMGNLRVWLGNKRQTFLQRSHQSTVKFGEFFDTMRAHTGTLNSIKNSRSFGNSRTGIPVSSSMRFPQLSISSGVSVASTNHIFSS
ncbi:hypothetical protein PsAD37_02059 [Pseudovibrio sp. Ad37]|nr:hypothetical protein PsAD37_02059 [Pseudovibrio sp. Ad37]